MTGLSNSQKYKKEICFPGLSFSTKKWFWFLKNHLLVVYSAITLTYSLVANHQSNLFMMSTNEMDKTIPNANSTTFFYFSPHRYSSSGVYNHLTPFPQGERQKGCKKKLFTCSPVHLWKFLKIFFTLYPLLFRLTF